MGIKIKISSTCSYHETYFFSTERIYSVFSNKIFLEEINISYNMRDYSEILQFRLILPITKTILKYYK